MVEVHYYFEKYEECMVIYRAWRHVQLTNQWLSLVLSLGNYKHLEAESCGQVLSISVFTHQLPYPVINLGDLVLQMQIYDGCILCFYFCNQHETGTIGKSEQQKGIHIFESCLYTSRQDS